MSPDQHLRVRELFDKALEQTGTERLSFLKSACADDAEVLQEAVRLIQSREEAPFFLENPVGGMQRIGRYVVTRELGRGAMGIVYDGVDPMIGRKVAIKVIRLQPLTESGEAGFLRERLFREARAAGALLHPGIVVVFDVGQDGDAAFIAMERVEGPSLYWVLSLGRKLESVVALDILRQTAVALDYAHEKGIVHRDVKPSNIMLHGGKTVKITDFGIAKITSAHQQTQTRLAMGTPSYMSPEQIEMRAVDGRSDQFALAVLAYELLAGVKPFEADSSPALAHMIVYGERPSARAVNPALREAADEVLHRGLATLPEERYATCGEFVAALEVATKGIPQAIAKVEGQTLQEISSPKAHPNPQLEISPRSKWQIWGSTNVAGKAWIVALGTTLLVVVGFFFMMQKPLSQLARNIPKPAQNNQARPVPPAPVAAPAPAERSREEQQQLLKFSQNFSQEPSLDAHWRENTPLLAALATAQSLRFVMPQLAFEKTGLKMAGVNGTYQFTGIQSQDSLSPPFATRVNVMGTIAHGAAFHFALASEDLHQYLAINGNLNSQNGGYYGIGANWVALNHDLGNQDGQLLDRDVSINQWYSIEISVRADGLANVTLSDSHATRHTKTDIPAGRGPFFVILGQREGLPYTIGPNEAIWSSFEIEQGASTRLRAR